MGMTPALRLLPLCLLLGFAPGTTCARQADSSEEFAVNLWTSTCAVADRMEHLAKIMKRYDVQRLDPDSAQKELAGTGGAAWVYRSSAYGKFVLAWRDTGECMISTPTADSKSAKAYFDDIVKKSVPGDWRIEKSHQTLERGGERTTYEVVAPSGRKGKYDIYTSSASEVPRQLLIVTRYQQPDEEWGNR